MVGPGKLMSRRIAEPVPPELPGLPPRPRVLQLTDGDCVSHGLADGTRRQRASDQEVRSCLDRVHATARLLDPHARIRCAVSTETATHHLAVLAAARNNLFTIRRGLDGADWALLEELADLIDARMVAARPGRKQPGPGCRSGDPRRPGRDLRTTGQEAAAARDPDLAARARTFRRHFVVQGLLCGFLHRGPKPARQCPRVASGWRTQSCHRGRLPIWAPPEGPQGRAGQSRMQPASPTALIPDREVRCYTPRYP